MKSKQKIDPAVYRELYEQGLKDTEIAARLGCTKQYCHKVREKLGLPTHRRGVVPMTDAQRAALNEWLLSNCPLRIGLQYSVSKKFAGGALHRFGRDETRAMCLLAAVTAAAAWDPSRCPFEVVVAFHVRRILGERFRKKHVATVSTCGDNDHEPTPIVSLLPARADDGPAEVDAADLLDSWRAKAGDLAPVLDAAMGTEGNASKLGERLGVTYVTAGKRRDRLFERMAG